MSTHSPENHTCMASRVREGILSLCSAVLRPDLQCCIHLWDSWCKKDMDMEQVQRRDTRMMHHSCDNRLGAGFIQPREERTPG